MQDIFDGLAIVAVITVICLVYYWQYSRSRGLVWQWAEQNGYEVLACDCRYLRKGPFVWTSSKGQTVYFVTNRDRDKQVRSGWVRCGGFVLGPLSTRTEVRWES